MKTLLSFLTILFIPFLAYAAENDFAGTFVDAKDPDLPADFYFQGEYVGNDMGAQVIGLDEGAFQVVLFTGGLPGAGWDGKNRSLLSGKSSAKKVSLKPAGGSRKYLAGPAEVFSATQKFPPEGHKPYTGSIAKGILTLLSKDDKNLNLKKAMRKSPTLEKKAPQGAITLFDGTNKEEWEGGRLDENTKLLNTDGSDIRTKRKFNDYHVHIEFLLPYRPAARGQGRGNSGFYQIDHFELQILDSFGLEGLNNECGGIYSIKKSDVNACFPPLTWQTYDVDFTNAKAKDGKKTKNAKITVRLNGIVIHDNFEIPRKTGGSRRDPEGTAGPIKLQGHGNPLQFRNIWILEK
jgi:hypothetical protein